ncbi:hypothetical protein [uncultured Anaerococcus sp.]|uniref:hypothetical protein n=1 Tax=uncultured Anaerococcus sp. TaxID=293428 RepID=UPI00260C5220|nr:hypothetical protein [uncultured Anaerococcus sp.]
MNISVEKSANKTNLIFPNDSKNKRLKLMVIFSPIFIACFDNGTYELEFLKKTIDKSKFSYGLYPEFFNDFDIIRYRKSYEGYEIVEDIFLNKDNKIVFTINPMDDLYIKALVSLIDKLIIDDKSNNYFIDYFDKMRDDIVINGRRSIIANGIKGFYLSKYVLVWMIDLCNYIKNNNPDIYPDVLPIYELSSNLKTIRTKKSPS